MTFRLVFFRPVESKYEKYVSFENHVELWKNALSDALCDSEVSRAKNNPANFLVVGIFQFRFVTSFNVFFLIHVI